MILMKMMLIMRFFRPAPSPARNTGILVTIPVLLLLLLLSTVTTTCIHAFSSDSPISPITTRATTTLLNNNINNKNHHHHHEGDGNSFSNIIRSTRTTTTRLFASNNNNVDKGFNLLEIASGFVPQGRIVQTAKESWKFVWKRMMIELAPQDKTGQYQRPTYGFSQTLGSQQYPIEGNNRYHVYVGNPCPWCHRVRLVVNILGLEDTVGLTVLIDDPIKASRGGWIFDKSPQQAQGVKDLRELYNYLSPGYQGRCTAPLLVDWKTRSIVSNESKDIVRMLPLLLQAKKQNNEDNNIDESSIIDLCPSELVTQIDQTNEWIYKLINNGVYRCGFSTTQQAYDIACNDVIEGLNRIEEILSRPQKYLCSDIKFTESDIMLLPTLLRFDGVYSPLFGAGSKLLRLEIDYPSTFNYLKRCWNDIDGIKNSIDIEDACQSYYKQLFPLNPGGILPKPVTSKSLHLD